MNHRARTNQLLYQARLMLDCARDRDGEPLAEAALEAATLFMYRALCSSIAEIGEAYQVPLQADRPLAELLAELGRQRPDGWEYRLLVEALRQGDHWMSQLRHGAEHWAGRVGQYQARPADDQLIELVADDNEDHTNHYRNWLDQLQQWVDEVRELGDFS